MDPYQDRQLYYLNKNISLAHKIVLRAPSSDRKSKNSVSISTPCLLLFFFLNYSFASPKITTLSHDTSRKPAEALETMGRGLGDAPKSPDIVCEGTLNPLVLIG